MHLICATEKNVIDVRAFNYCQLKSEVEHLAMANN